MKARLVSSRTDSDKDLAKRDAKILQDLTLARKKNGKLKSKKVMSKRETILADMSKSNLTKNKKMNKKKVPFKKHGSHILEVSKSVPTLETAAGHLRRGKAEVQKKEPVCL